MIDEEILLIITNEITGQASKDELERLNDWLEESKENEELCFAYRQAFVNGKYTVKTSNTDQAFDKLEKRIALSKNPFYSKSWRHMLSRAAAIILIAISMLFIFHHFYHNIDTSKDHEAVLVIKSNPRGIKSLIELPDGSKVKLNAESYIEYKRNFSTGRQIKLVGEAFFEVVRDTLNPFVINCGDVQVQVLGTSFNVQAYPFGDRMSVAVACGQVKVENKFNMHDGQSSLVTDNQMLMIDHNTGKIELGDFKPGEVLAWKDGILVFKQASFQQIVQQLERWYGVDFVMERQKPITEGFTGRYENTSLEVVMEGMSFSSDFKYKIEGNIVYIN